MSPDPDGGWRGPGAGSALARPGEGGGGADARTGRDGRPGGGPTRTTVHGTTVGMPGWLALLLAVPAFLAFGVLALIVVVLAVMATVLAPWLLRRSLRRLERELATEVEQARREEEAGPAIELPRDAYHDASRGRDPSAREDEGGGAAHDMEIVAPPGSHRDR